MQTAVRRLTPEESDRLLQQSTPRPEEGRYPSKVRIDWLARVLGKSDRTIARYRVIAFEELEAYQAFCIETNPGYLLGTASLPDKPPLMDWQAKAIAIISRLFDEFKDESLVRYELGKFNETMQ
ncbi:MAG: hypothetical protein F6K14_26820 [Symploca sp. SIO2C1]|nr:hypothetical protein [Symploca sp. SIO2C1]